MLLYTQLLELILREIKISMEIARIKSGGYFQSMKTADVSIYVVYKNMKEKNWRKPLPAIKNCSYDLKQMFCLKFKTQFS